jgi:hypothetical protein
MGLHLGGIGTRIAIFDQDIVAGRPSELPEPLAEILKITLRVRVVLGNPQQYRDPSHSVRLLRTRGKRPRDRCAAQRGYQFSSSDVDFHLTPRIGHPFAHVSTAAALRDELGIAVATIASRALNAQRPERASVR